MINLTTPTDLLHPVNRVDELLGKIEEDFKNNPKYDEPSDVRQDPKRAVEIVGYFTAADRSEVCRLYCEAGWETVSQMPLIRGDYKVARFVFTAKKIIK